MERGLTSFALNPNDIRLPATVYITLAPSSVAKYSLIKGKIGSDATVLLQTILVQRSVDQYNFRDFVDLRLLEVR